MGSLKAVILNRIKYFAAESRLLLASGPGNIPGGPDSSGRVQACFALRTFNRNLIVRYTNQ